MYKQNYLKYKSKYLELKNQIYGGAGGAIGTSDLDNKSLKYIINLTFKAIETRGEKDKIITNTISYLIPPTFKPEHHIQLKDLILDANKNGLIDRNLRSIHFHSSPTDGLREVGTKYFEITDINFTRYSPENADLDSIESVLTDFNSREFCVIILLCSYEGKKVKIIHPFPKNIKELGKDSKEYLDLVSQYKNLYQKPNLVIEKVEHNDMNTIIYTKELRRFFKYFTPSQPKIEPIPTSQELRIIELESKMSEMQKMISTMQEKLSEYDKKYSAVK